MEVKVKGLHKSQIVIIPVIIGTVPLTNNLAGDSVIQQQPMQSLRDRPTDLDFIKDDTNLATFELNSPNMRMSESSNTTSKY